MANPWMKKDPLLSIWLSAASARAGAARGMMAAEVRRQQRVAVKPASPARARKNRRKTR